MRPQQIPQDLLISIRFALAILLALSLPERVLPAAQAPATDGRIQVIVDASTDMLTPIGDAERVALAREFLDALHAGLAAGDAPGPALRSVTSGCRRAA